MALTGVFGASAYAATCPLASGDDLADWSTHCPGLTSGNTISIPAGATVTVTGAVTLDGVSISMGAGSTLTGNGPLTFSGVMPGYYGAISIVPGTAAAPTKIQGLTINDNSSGGEATIYETTGGYVTLSDNKLTRSAPGTHWGITTTASTSNVITGNTFSGYDTPVYTNANNTDTLQLTGNTFTNSGSPVLDYTFLQNPPNKIENNTFDSSDSTPNIVFMDSAFGSTYVSTPADYQAILNANPTVAQVEDYNGQTNSAVTRDYPVAPRLPPRNNGSLTPVPTLGDQGLLALALFTLVMGAIVMGRTGYARRGKR